MSYDVAIIGAGHNGLTTAATLAKSGRKVVVLERRTSVGGLAAGEEFEPGYRTPGLLHDSRLVRRGVLDSLGLLGGESAVRFRSEAPAMLVIGDSPAGQAGLLLHEDPAKAQAEIAKHQKEDAGRYTEYRALVAELSKPLRKLMDEAPPDIGSADKLRTQWQMLKTALSVRMLGKHNMLELMRALPMPLKDFLDDLFQSEVLKAGLAAGGLHGLWGGPYTPHSTTYLMLREAVAGPGLVGGPASLATALEAACKRFGVEIRAGQGVRRIRLTQGRATGVELENGETINARVVASSIHPKQTFLDLLEPMDRTLAMQREAQAIRSRGTVVKVHLALSGPLVIKERSGERPVHIQVGDTLDYLERAFDPVKYGRYATAPHLDIYVPTVEDPSLAPKGHEVVSIVARCAPHDLEGGWTDTMRETFGNIVVGTLAKHAPNLKEVLVGREVLTPKDLSDRYGLYDGDTHHGELALDQLLPFRPSPACARYATPIEGLYLCGSGSHPGGGITCAPGALAAKAIRRA